MALGYLAGEIDNDLQATRAGDRSSPASTSIQAVGPSVELGAKKLPTRVRRVLAMS
jgi:hypothetical protein